MLKFFRRIRQKLLSKNKFSRYLLYAIGEIVLVMIGILLALQVNTWNEQKKTGEKELKYLSLIKQEMGTNLQAIKEEQVVLDDFLSSVNRMLLLYATPDPTLTNKQLSEILVPILSRDMDFNFKDGTLNEVISTGNLKDITNDNIRNILASIGGNLERVRAQEGTVNDYISKANNYIAKKGSIKQIVLDTEDNEVFGIPESADEISNLFLLKSQEFETLMVYSALTGVSLDEEYYSVFIQEINSLIDLIDKELKR